MVQIIQICIVTASLVDSVEALISRWPLHDVSTFRTAGQKIQRERNGAATAAAPVTRALFIPSGSLDPLASSSLHCITNCGYFGSRRAGDGALVTNQPHSYHWARNETMDFFIRALTLTACLPCVHCLLCCSLPVENRSERRKTSPVTF